MKRYVNTLVLILEIACICFLHALKLKESGKSNENISPAVAKSQNAKAGNLTPGNYILLKVK